MLHCTHPSGILRQFYALQEGKDLVDHIPQASVQAGQQVSLRIWLGLRMVLVPLTRVPSSLTCLRLESDDTLGISLRCPKYDAALTNLLHFAPG